MNHVEWLYRAHAAYLSQGRSVMLVDVDPIADWFAKAREDEIETLMYATPIVPPSDYLVCAFGQDVLSIFRFRDATNDFVTIEQSVISPGMPAVGLSALPIDESGRWGAGVSGIRPFGSIGGMPTLRREVMCFAACVLAMFHVKNIGTREVAYPRAMRRPQERTGLRGAPRTYHVLTIRPLRDSTARPNGGGSHGERPLHTVRGHFARYSADAPMLGRYVGTFFRPEHERGNSAKGILHKTYRVKP